MIINHLYLTGPNSLKDYHLTLITLHMANDITTIVSIVEKIQSAAQILQQNDEYKEIPSSTESARKALIQAAERLVVAARRPEENIHATTLTVRVFMTKVFSFLRFNSICGFKMKAY